MWMVRPAQQDDLDGIEQLAIAEGARVSRLPQERDQLKEKLDYAVRSFAADPSLHGRERFLLVLVDTSSGRIHGTAGIEAHAGDDGPFYNYRLDELIHSSHALQLSQHVAVLYLTHALSGRALLGSFCLDSSLRNTPAFELLSRSRLLFMAQHRQVFPASVIVEVQGLLTEAGQSPFWDSLGQHFFHMDFATADYYSSVKSKTFIAELMPPQPIYVTLLSEAAQATMGQANPRVADVVQLLQREGFAKRQHIDIFDGGPVLEGELNQLASLRALQRCPLRRDKNAQGDRNPAGDVGLLANTRREGFCCLLATLAHTQDNQLCVIPRDADLLGVDDGGEVLFVPLVLPQPQ